MDLGAYTGDTVLSYLKNYGEDCYQRIYCYEITPETFQVLQETLAPYRDVVCRQKGVGDAEGTLSLVNHQTSASSNTLGHETGEAVPVTTLDTDIPEPITMIKADIYLSKRPCKGQNHILRDHPKLLFSVYHNNEDLWKIPPHDPRPLRGIHLLPALQQFPPLSHRDHPLCPLTGEKGRDHPTRPPDLWSGGPCCSGCSAWRNSSRHWPDCRMAWAWSRPTYR